MPLMKLWNSLLGRSAPAKEQPVRSANPTTDHARLGGSASRKPTKKSGRSAKGSRLSLFGGGGPHGALRKLVKPLQAKTVLEISVGDGSRAIAVLETLGEAQKVRYMAIDQFEMADIDRHAQHRQQHGGRSPAPSETSGSELAVARRSGRRGTGGASVPAPTVYPFRPATETRLAGGALRTQAEGCDPVSIVAGIQGRPPGRHPIQPIL